MSVFQRYILRIVLEIGLFLACLSAIGGAIHWWLLDWTVTLICLAILFGVGVVVAYKKAVPSDRAWHEEFGEFAVAEEKSHRNLLDGVGLYSGKTVWFKVDVQVEGIYIEDVLGETSPVVHLPWDLVSSIDITKLAYRKDASGPQQLAKIRLTGGTNPLSIPWNEKFNQLVPSKVGLRAVEHRKLYARRVFIIHVGSFGSRRLAYRA